MSEQAVIVKLNGEQLMSIVHQGHKDNDTAVLVVVGGPQYRVGSHRQFIQLSRSLAKNGITSMRFDYRGMGDSEGEKQSFAGICEDIKAAIDALIHSQGQIKNIVIWGLCDAASSALIYAHKDPRVCGIVLLNPWLRNEQAMGKTMVKYYYLQRLLSKGFWKKLLTGQVNVTASVNDAKGFVKDSVVHCDVDESSYQARMLTGLQAFQGRVCLILSGEDITAREFDQQTNNNKTWQKLRMKSNETHRLPNADHTFSSAVFKSKVEKITFSFIQSISKG
ncbi:MAG: hydrolase 1, exosortase A system-associated [Colwellia sp.]|nr:hydrolase 1, exosortase A system-associated [Colwellia sp.]